MEANCGTLMERAATICPHVLTINNRNEKGGLCSGKSKSKVEFSTVSLLIG